MWMGHVTRVKGGAGQGGSIQFRMQALLITVFVKTLNLFGSRVIPFALVTGLRVGGSVA